MGSMQYLLTGGTDSVKKFLVALFVSVFISGTSLAQEATLKPDSTRLYENIETYSNRSRFTMFMYRLIFKPVAPVSKKKVYKKLIQKPYSVFEGKYIRNIDIVTLDPFGYSPLDTIIAPQNFLHRTGNKLHIKSQAITIRNLLLFRKNDQFNSLRVKESERLIRSQKYVHEVSFSVVNTGKASDSVDIFIRELDRWSIIPEGSVSTAGMISGITDKNFLGTGHEFHNVFTRNFHNEINTFNTDYTIPNIRNTYISTMLHIGFDGYGNLNKSLTVDRPFYSSITKWAAGVSFSSVYRKDSLRDINSVYHPMTLKFRTQDYWAGKAIQIFKGNTENARATNLILTMRYLRIRFSEKPAGLNDPMNVYSNEDFYLAGMGFSSRKYVQDKYIFKYGVIEDIPVGKAIGLTGGYQVRNSSSRPYAGLKFSMGDYYSWGYLSSSFEYGTFFHGPRAEQGVITAGINYFTGLYEIGRWKIRQFIKPQISIGIGRFAYDSLTLNDGYGLDGFNSLSISGTHRLLLTIQTQSYAPWRFIGFRFGPYLSYSMGMLGNAGAGFKNSKVYSRLGLGVLIKNENLVFNTFQFSISFYPLIPGIGQNVFKLNSFRTTDLGFRDFEIGKPNNIIFQ
jgi:hypothetical protein